MEVRTIRGGMFYGSLFLMTLLCGGLGTLIAWVATSSEPIGYGMLAFSAFFYFMGIYSIVKFIKNTPIVRMSDEGIRYRGRWYGWAQITYANFRTQRVFPTIGKSGKPMDAITLSFDDGNELHLFDGMYWNADEIRRYLQVRVKANLVVTDKEDEAEKPDEATVRKDKRKTNLFIFGFVATAMLFSFLVVYFEVEGIAKAFMVLAFNVAFIIVFVKMFRKKRAE